MGVKEFWQRTVFPDMIKRKKEEKELRKDIQHEAKMEALKEMKDDLKEEYKKKEKDRISGKGGSFLDKLSKGFDGSTLTANSDDKINRMLGQGTTIDDEKIVKGLSQRSLGNVPDSNTINKYMKLKR
jgi:hypothetical protein